MGRLHRTFPGGLTRPPDPPSGDLTSPVPSHLGSQAIWIPDIGRNRASVQDSVTSDPTHERGAGPKVFLN